MRAKPLPTKYSKTGVGKLIGNCVYVHRNYTDKMHPEHQQVIADAKTKIGNASWNILKYDLKSHSVSFINSPDFDTAHEPSIQSSISVAKGGQPKALIAGPDPWIYHHKWLMVGDDYKGFDIAQSKARSAQWMSLPSVDYSRIGKKSFWEKHVVPKLKDR